MIIKLKSMQNLEIKNLEKAPSSEERVVAKEKEREKEMEFVIETEGDQDPVNVYGMDDLRHLFLLTSV